MGLHARRPGAAVVKVLLGCDSRSFQALVPDARVIDRGFHVITLVDMGDTSGPDVSIADLSLLQLQCQYQSCPVCLGCSRSLNNCVTDAKSDIVALKLMAARSAERESNLTWVVT